MEWRSVDDVEIHVPKNDDVPLPVSWYFHCVAVLVNACASPGACRDRSDLCAGRMLLQAKLREVRCF